MPFNWLHSCCWLLHTWNVCHPLSLLASSATIILRHGRWMVDDGTTHFNLKTLIGPYPCPQRVKYSSVHCVPSSVTSFIHWTTSNQLCRNLSQKSSSSSIVIKINITITIIIIPTSLQDHSRVVHCHPSLPCCWVVWHWKRRMRGNSISFPPQQFPESSSSFDVYGATYTAAWSLLCSDCNIILSGGDTFTCVVKRPASQAMRVPYNVR